MEADNEVLERKSRETEEMRLRVEEMEEVKQLMEKQVKDYTIYEVRFIIIIIIIIIISLLMSPLLGHRPSLWITHKENAHTCGCSAAG
jgi:preprotein translocase subunit Sec63